MQIVLVCLKVRHFGEAAYDQHLRKFEHARALDAVLKPYVQNHKPERTYSVIKELRRRGALRTALAGRDEKSLSSVLKFVQRYIADQRYADIVIEVADIVLGEFFEFLLVRDQQDTCKDCTCFSSRFQIYTVVNWAPNQTRINSSRRCTGRFIARRAT